MRTRSWWLIACVVGLLACGGEGSEDPASGSTTTGAGGGGGAGGAGGAPPSAIGDHAFGAFAPWAAPIEDYKAVGEQVLPGDYDQAIHELMPFGDRLWLGYGDGTYNMGEHTPIELRYFASEVDPTAAAAPVAAEGEGAPQDTPTQSGEEQIDRYRLCEGELYQAGVDSIDADELHTQATTDPPAIEGNAYRLAGDTWAKHRSMPGGEHVHDLAGWGGAVYGVGSGADFRFEFEAGEIYRYLWRSDDQGATFTTVQRIGHPQPGAGDTRWVHLLPTTARLFLFGYESTFASNSATVENAGYDGATVDALPMSDPLAAMFAFGTAALPDGSGLVHGVDVSSAPLRYSLWHVTADGAATRLDSFAGKRVVDVGVYPDTGEILYLVYAGDEYPGPDMPASYDAAVLVAPIAAPGDTKELVQHASAVAPFSIAFWRHALFVGTDDGQVLKAE